MEKKRTLTTEQLEDASRLKALYESKKKELGITQADIADELGISQGAVGHYLNGRNPLNLPVAAVFARILREPISSFSPSLAKEAELLSQVSNVKYEGPVKPRGSYPLISWVSAGSWAEAVEPYTLKEIDDWYDSDAHIEGQGFWLKVQGDSMTSPVGLSITEGMYVLVDTGKEAKNGNLVIAKLTDANEATFKKLVIDAGNKYLKPLNPQYPLIPINGNCKIIGVVVQAMMWL
ncbi:TPA: helix-turn-helix domain-containing protein [Kluyvera intermedia]|uniref:Peptidase S24 n=2 Tax=Enterobacteriaceae TaxID=543 RepID=A0AAC8QQ29_9ENTR|nr:S24 family peptidase [Phytobacter ursingii]HAT2207693.1 helix-turn-helix domain-containing protein [Kluyvera intermedia]AKL12778.1 peptidase S24 [Phytobacter ursingii]HAT2518378.1 helix-turn-helix domain-containing protein [Kluyvera intermedia]HAT2606502.1 helix-turn-helix domain-containing protein [Kluyvera intermedia]HAT2683270.1 helix-turn-helix domain-containing protein [Kluyvera intermedia]